MAPLSQPAPTVDPALVLAKAILSAAGRLDLRQHHLAAVLGVSAASVSRLVRGRGIDPASKQGELALLFLRVYRSLDALVGGDEGRARQWVHAENDHLGGVPAERIATVQGLVDVAEYLDAMRGRL
jgi:transcriptional regulator with XRE-family HTH domain